MQFYVSVAVGTPIFYFIFLSSDCFPAMFLMSEPKGQLLLINGRTEDEVLRSLERVLLTMRIATSEPKVCFTSKIHSYSLWRKKNQDMMSLIIVVICLNGQNLSSTFFEHEAQLIQNVCSIPTLYFLCI